MCAPGKPRQQLATHIWVRSQASMQSLQKRCMQADTARVFLIIPALLVKRAGNWRNW